MLKKNLILAAGMLFATGAFAATLTPQQALDRAASTPEGKKSLKSNVQPTLAYTAKTVSGEAAVYVFNQAANGGIVLLSADDIALPVLGYTDAGSFDPANIPPQMAYWMDSYASQIEYAKKNGMKSKARQEAPSNWTAIAPMLTTQWDQGTPFNNQTPTSGNTHMPTGCVATAMAQIMNYWKYPETGRGSVSYTSGSNRLSMSFNRENFDWANMIDNYIPGMYNETQANAVSYLMKACGFGSKMQYAPGGSGTQTMDAGAALVNYFYYDKSVNSVDRLVMTDDEWTAFVYDQLKNVGPAMYSGTASGGGHAWVVDGYDGNGYFHMNWGWGGTCNGYYLLTAMNPTVQGTGGFYGGYNFGQGLLYNIRKPAKDSDMSDGNMSWQGSLTMYGNLNATNNGNVITFTLANNTEPGYYNVSMGPVNTVFGFEAQPVGGGEITYTQCSSPSNLSQLKSGAYYPASTVKPVARFNNDLPDGEYKVTLVYKNGSTSTTWNHFEKAVGYNDYVIIKKIGKSYAVVNVSPAQFNITDAKIITPLYYNNPCQFELTFDNPTDFDLTQMVVPTLLIDGKVNYESDSQLVAVPAHSKLTQKMTYTFTRVDGGKTPSTASPVEFQFSISDTNSGQNYGTFGNYTMYRSSTNMKLNVENLEITNAGESNAAPYGTVFGIDDYRDIAISLTLEMTSNNSFLAAPLTASVYKFDTETRRNGALVYEKDFPNYIYLSSGNKVTEKVSLNMSQNYNIADTYAVVISYTAGTSRSTIGTLYFAASSGVDDIISDAGNLSVAYDGRTINATSEAGIANITIMNAGGMIVASHNAASVSTANLSNGIYIVRATDRKGNTRTLKIRK